MSPEQVRGQQTDHRTDIFSFGALLYEMLSGRRAFEGQSRADTMTAILNEHPPRCRHRRAARAGLRRIVDRCLEKNPGARFQSAHDLGFALEGLSSHSDAISRQCRRQAGDCRRGFPGRSRQSRRSDCSQLRRLPTDRPAVRRRRRRRYGFRSRRRGRRSRSLRRRTSSRCHPTGVTSHSSPRMTSGPRFSGCDRSTRSRPGRSPARTARGSRSGHRTVSRSRTSRSGRCGGCR